MCQAPARHFTCTLPQCPHHSEAGPASSPLDRGGNRLRDVKQLAQGHRAELGFEPRSVCLPSLGQVQSAFPRPAGGSLIPAGVQRGLQSAVVDIGPLPDLLPAWEIQAVPSEGAGVGSARCARPTLPPSPRTVWGLPFS